jgi:uncharacterized protein YciI
VSALSVLRYEYVEDVLERRGPFRGGHLALIDEWASDGRIVAAGATGEPVRGGLLVFALEPAEVAAFVSADPYVAGGIVASHEIVPWTIVAGAGLPAVTRSSG